MPVLAQVVEALEQIAPLRLAADWDSVGLLVDGRRTEIARVLTCLSLTPEVAAEAVREKTDLVVTHHPLPFRPVPRITTATPTGRVLLELIGSGIAVYSPHTAWDSAAGGINDQLAALAQLGHVHPIEPDPLHHLAGFGRVGSAPEGWTVERLARHLARALGVKAVQVVGPERIAGRVGIVCGSGGDALTHLASAGCTAFVTGELKLHQALDAQGLGMAVIALGHHASERFAMETLARRLAERVPGIDCRASRADTDPFAWVD